MFKATLAVSAACIAQHLHSRSKESMLGQSSIELPVRAATPNLSFRLTASALPENHVVFALRREVNGIAHHSPHSMSMRSTVEFLYDFFKDDETGLDSILSKINFAAIASQKPVSTGPDTSWSCRCSIRPKLQRCRCESHRIFNSQIED